MKNFAAVLAFPYFLISGAVTGAINYINPQVPAVEINMDEGHAVMATKYEFVDAEGSTIIGERPAAVVEFTVEDVKILNTPRAVVLMDDKNATVVHRVRMGAIILFAERAGLTVTGSNRN